MSDPKPQVILDLEQEQEFDFILMKVQLTQVWSTIKSFSKNSKGEITGLNFDDEKISNIKHSLDNLDI